MTEVRLNTKELVGMTVIIGAMPDSQWEQLTPLLEQFGWQAPQANDPESWYQTPEAAPGLSANSRYLLLHARPETVVASGMQIGKDPAEALNQWQTSSQHLLNFYKRNRRQSLLLEVDSIRKYPQRCFESVSSHFEFDVKGEVNNLDTIRDVPPQCQLLANQFVLQSNLPPNIVPELQACTFPLTDESYTEPTLQITELCQEFLASNNAEKQSSEALMDVQEENALLLEQLYRVQEELEVYYMKSKDRDSDIEKLEGQIKDGNRKLQTEVKNLTSKVQEKDKKLQNNDRAVRRAQESRKKLEKSLEKASRELKRARITIDQLKNSTSWKITAPMRAVVMAVSRNKK